MEARCYIAIFVFAALATVLGYMVFHRLKSDVKSNVNVPGGVATASTPLATTAKAT